MFEDIRIIEIINLLLKKELKMFKKTVVTSLVALALGSSVHAIEFPDGASPFFYSSSTAYSSATFNSILEAYGLKLSPEGAEKLAMSYASTDMEKVHFNSTPVAYTPAKYHQILTSYGLELKPESVEDILKVSSYAETDGTEIVFGTAIIAYDGQEWENILEAYSLPMMGMEKDTMEMAPDREMKKEPMKESMPGDSDGDGITDDKDACPGTPAGVKVDERGCWVMSEKVLFDFDKAIVKEEFYPILNATKKVFDAQPELRVRIEGHTDSVGTEAYNQGLSERRAKAVMEYLVEKLGIAQDRLGTRGYGELSPAYPNDTAQNRAKNRRVEFTTIQ